MQKGYIWHCKDYNKVKQKRKPNQQTKTNKHKQTKERNKTNKTKTNKQKKQRKQQRKISTIWDCGQQIKIKTQRISR